MITSINEILTEWAFRTKDGQPNPKSMAHQILLEGILKNYGWSMEARAELLNNLMEAGVKQYASVADGRAKAQPGEKWQVALSKGGRGKIYSGPKGEGGGEEEAPKKVAKPEDIKTRSEEADNAVSNQIDATAQTDDATKKRIKNLVSKAFNNEKLNKGEAEFLSKWVRVVEPTEETESSKPNFKIYVAYNEGDFRRTTGEKRAQKVDMKTSIAAKTVHRNLQKAGLITQRVSTFGGKKTAPNQLYATKGQVNIIEKPKPVLGIDETDEIKKAKDVIKKAPKSLKKGSEEWEAVREAKKKVAKWARQAKSVQIGKLTIKKQDLKQYKKGSDKYKKAARNNREMAELAEKIALGEMDFIDMDEGVYPDSSENRVKVIKSAIGNMLAHFNDLAKKPIGPGIPAADLDVGAQDILDKLEVFATADPNGNGNPFDTAQEWMDNFEATMSEFANNDPLKEGWANFAEVYTSIRAMHANGQGTANGKCSLLPESSTLETVDVIEIAAASATSKYVTLDGVSVKKGEGGASALTSKVKKAVMNNGVGIKAKELRREIIRMSSSHTDIYRDDVDHIEYRKKMVNVAKKAGVPDDWIKAVLKASKTSSKVDSALKTMMKNRMKNAPPKKSSEYAAFIANEQKAKVELRERLESYYVYTYLSHMAYNEAVLAQDFDNESVLSQKGDTSVKRYNSVTGKYEKYIDTGSTLADEKRIEIDSSDGISVLAYARPTFDVGFSDDGRSSNPGSGRLKNKAKKPGWEFYESIL